MEQDKLKSERLTKRFDDLCVGALEPALPEKVLPDVKSARLPQSSSGGKSIGHMSRFN